VASTFARSEPVLFLIVDHVKRNIQIYIYSSIFYSRVKRQNFAIDDDYCVIHLSHANSNSLQTKQF
jgi:hypothetical protein